MSEPVQKDGYLKVYIPPADTGAEQESGKALASYHDDVTGFHATIYAPKADPMHKDDCVISVQDADDKLCYKSHVDSRWLKTTTDFQNEMKSAICEALAETRSCYNYTAPMHDNLPKDKESIQPDRIYGTLHDTRTGLEAQVGTTGILDEEPYVRFTANVVDADGHTIVSNTYLPDEVPYVTEPWVKKELLHALDEANQKVLDDPHEDWRKGNALRQECIHRFLQTVVERPGLVSDEQIDQLFQAWNDCHKKDGYLVAFDLKDASNLLNDTQHPEHPLSFLGSIDRRFSTEDHAFWMESGFMVSGSELDASERCFCLGTKHEINMATSLAWHDSRLKEFPLEIDYSVEKRLREDTMSLMYRYEDRIKVTNAAEYLLTHDFKELKEDFTKRYLAPKDKIFSSHPDDTKFCLEVTLGLDGLDSVRSDQQPSAAAKWIAEQSFIGHYEPVEALFSANKEVREQAVQNALHQARSHTKMSSAEKRVLKLVDDIDKYNYIDSTAAEHRFNECNQKLQKLGIDKATLKKFDDALCLADDTPSKLYGVEQAKKAIVKEGAKKLKVSR